MVKTCRLDGSQRAANLVFGLLTTPGSGAACRNWLRNARAHPSITLSRGRRTETMTAWPASGVEVLSVIRPCIRTVPATGPYRGVTADSSDEKIQFEAVSHPMFCLQPV